MSIGLSAIQEAQWAIVQFVSYSIPHEWKYSLWKQDNQPQGRFACLFHEM
jgi:hypothetical protein